MADELLRRALCHIDKAACESVNRTVPGELGPDRIIAIVLIAIVLFAAGCFAAALFL